MDLSKDETPTSQLGALPEEILRKIVKRLCGHCRDINNDDEDVSVRKTKNEGWEYPATLEPAQPPGTDLTERHYASNTATLNALSRVSRRIHSISNDILYHEFNTPNVSTWTPNSPEGCDWIKRLLAFKRSIEARPQLGELTRRLRIHLSLVEYAEIRSELGLTGDPTYAGLLPANNPDTWIPPSSLSNDCNLHPHGRNPQWPLALLRRLPNLEFLSVVKDPENFAGCCCAGAHGKVMPELAIPKLHGLEIISVGTASVHRKPLVDILTYCAIDCMTKLVLHDFGHAMLKELPSGLQNLRHLQMTMTRRWFPYERSSWRFLKDCKKMETFVYEAIMGKESTYVPRGVNTFLLASSDTLHHLHLDVDCLRRGADPLIPIHRRSSRPAMPLIGTLARLENLRTIFLNSSLIFPRSYHRDEAAKYDAVLVDCLPSSLVHLKIATCNGLVESAAKDILAMTVGALVRLAQAIQAGSFSKLKTIRLSGTQTRLCRLDPDTEGRTLIEVDLYNTFGIIGINFDFQQMAYSTMDREEVEPWSDVELAELAHRRKALSHV